jgi:hypothetical protein
VFPQVRAAFTRLRTLSGWRDLNSRPLAPDIGSVSKDVPRRPISLEIRILHRGVFQ